MENKNLDDVVGTVEKIVTEESNSSTNPDIIQEGLKVVAKYHELILMAVAVVLFLWSGFLTFSFGGLILQISGIYFRYFGLETALQFFLLFVPALLFGLLNLYVGYKVYARNYSLEVLKKLTILSLGSTGVLIVLVLIFKSTLIAIPHLFVVSQLILGGLVLGYKKGVIPFEFTGKTFKL